MLKPGSDCNSYYHELFLRGRPDLAEIMTRLTNAVKKVHNPDEEPDFYDMAKWLPLSEEEFFEDDQQLVPGAYEPNAQLDDSGNEREAMYRDQERFMYPIYPNTSSCYQSEYVDGYTEAKYETWQYPYQQTNGSYLKSVSHDSQQMQREDFENNFLWNQEEGYNNGVPMAQDRNAYVNHGDRSHRTNRDPYANGLDNSPDFQSLAQNHSFAQDIEAAPSASVARARVESFLASLTDEIDSRLSNDGISSDLASLIDEIDSRSSSRSSNDSKRSYQSIDKSGQTKKARLSSYGFEKEAKIDTNDGASAFNLLDTSTYNNKPYLM